MVKISTHITLDLETYIAIREKTDNLSGLINEFLRNYTEVRKDNKQLRKKMDKLTIQTEIDELNKQLEKIEKKEREAIEQEAKDIASGKVEYLNLEIKSNENY